MKEIPQGVSEICSGNEIVDDTLVDLENKGQGRHTQNNSRGLVTTHMQNGFETPVRLRVIAKNICGGGDGGTRY